MHVFGSAGLQPTAEVSITLGKTIGAHYLWCSIFDRKSCATARDYQIDRVLRVGPALDEALDVEDIIGNDIDSLDVPLASAFSLKDFFERVAALVCRRILCGGFGNDEDSCFELRHCGCVVSSASGMPGRR